MTDLDWNGCLNARDVAGLPTRYGGTTRAGIIRTDSLHQLDDAGWAAFHQVRAGLVLDLRSDWEMTEPHPLDGDPAYRRIPWIDPVADQRRMPADEPLMVDIYRGSLDRNQGQILKAYRAIAEVPLDVPVVVHCRSGKDRTGLLVALLQELAGVPGDVIAADYAMSETRLGIPDRIAALPGTDEERAAAGLLWRSLPETILGALDHVDQRYGGVRAYLARCGLSAREIHRLGLRLLTPVEFEAVVFDFDGLLINTETTLVESWQAEARDLGLRVGIASSSPRSWVTGHLERVGALDLFDLVVTGDEVAAHKPDPAVYQLALSRLDLPGRLAVAVENTAHGVAAAAAAGMRTVAMATPDVPAETLTGAGLVLTGADQLSLSEALFAVSP
ncbi:HAD-superfamily hydrolase, subfamily IA, variant 3 [Kribbella flavida DSM 17836]|uniref:HAD-superfamily hydrolase, subfamily IA, variant 3 n=1 Tax=Kribbella flavida (strain DSM 17836 / JCM 10339 / NBRC 14399) TaxID=479435 RepID=D2PUS2_KRIFD|nr:HAD-IA family hydrolase [Kribbella flavida]ADB31388.1 HAD-superfamily hydrolase, subfamily IA, variant 3 [Kribbella flavida DSM 17836]